MSFVKTIILAAIIGLAAGALGAYLYVNYYTPSQNALIKDFYLTENAVHVSPHSLRGKMDKGISDYVLVDLRSAEEYNHEHIIGAVNIPAYKDRDTPAYEDTARIIAAFKALPQGKDVVVYCYSMPCMTGRKIGKMLAENGVYVKHLGIGWNEWRYFWTLWNHEHEWNSTKAEDYIWSGPEPGVPKRRDTNDSTACSLSNQYGC